MKERSIIFSGEMVRAILGGRKTQTRRVVVPQSYKIFWNTIVVNGYGGWTDEHGRPRPCPYGQSGDRLTVELMIGTYMMILSALLLMARQKGEALMIRDGQDYAPLRRWLNYRWN